MIYNTTYTMSADDEQQFCIWVKECMLPQVEQDGVMHSPRLLRVLSHQQDDSTSYCLQLEVPDTGALHKWYLRQGAQMAQELVRVFNGRIVGFSTLLEDV